MSSSSPPQKPYITVHLMGGLGNQLFQLFATIAYAIQYKIPFAFPYSKQLLDGIPRPTYWDTLFRPLKQNTHTPQQLQPPYTYKEPCFHYSPLPAFSAMTNSFQLFGYFQSWRYFEPYKTHILELLQLPALRQSIREKYTAECCFADTTTPTTKISLHFRLGDYKEKQQYHPIATLDYYKTALQSLLEKTQQTAESRSLVVLYFCEADDLEFVQRERIEPLKQQFPNIQFQNIPAVIPDWEQLLLMSCCDHHIIANSSFSWWGAYLGEALGGGETSIQHHIYYPAVWFGEALQQNNTKDLCPSWWNKI